MPDAVERWAQVEYPKRQKNWSILRHVDSRILIWHQTGTSNINKQRWILNIHHHVWQLHSPELLMWCLPLQCLYGFLSRLCPIFGLCQAPRRREARERHHGWIYWLGQVICIHLPLDERHSVKGKTLNIFHKVSFDSNCWIKFSPCWISFFPQKFVPNKKVCPLTSSEASSSQSFFISHCSGLPGGYGTLFSKIKIIQIGGFWTNMLQKIVHIFCSSRNVCLSCISQVFDSRLPYSRVFELGRKLGKWSKFHMTSTVGVPNINSSKKNTVNIIELPKTIKLVSFFWGKVCLFVPSMQWQRCVQHPGGCAGGYPGG